MRIIIEALPAKDMRYPTLGDWFVDQQGDLKIQVVGADPLTGDEAFLIALHELVEAKLCHKRGIREADVDGFDLAFRGEGEPGDHPDAPYRREHRFAMIVEHAVAHELGMDGYGCIA